MIIWDKIFKSGPSKICGRQPLKPFQNGMVFFKGCLPQILLCPFLNTFSHMWHQEILNFVTSSSLITRYSSILSVNKCLETIGFCGSDFRFDCMLLKTIIPFILFCDLVPDLSQLVRRVVPITHFAWYDVILYVPICTHTFLSCHSGTLGLFQKHIFPCQESLSNYWINYFVQTFLHIFWRVVATSQV